MGWYEEVYWILVGGWITMFCISSALIIAALHAQRKTKRLILGLSPRKDK